MRALRSDLLLLTVPSCIQLARRVPLSGPCSTVSPPAMPNWSARAALYRSTRYTTSTTPSQLVVSELVSVPCYSSRSSWCLVGCAGVQHAAAQQRTAHFVFRCELQPGIIRWMLKAGFTCCILAWLHLIGLHSRPGILQLPGCSCAASAVDASTELA